MNAYLDVRVRAVGTAEAVLRRDSLVGGTVLLQTVVLKEQKSSEQRPFQVEDGRRRRRLTSEGL